MKITKSEQVVFTDIDDTLVIHNHAKYPELSKIRVWDSLGNFWVTVAVHEPHVRLLRERKRRGAHVVALSAGGFAWAKNVVLALGLEDVVDDVYSKPVLILDDLKTNQAYGPSTYIKPTSRWKATNGR